MKKSTPTLNALSKRLKKTIDTLDEIAKSLSLDHGYMDDDPGLSLLVNGTAIIDTVADMLKDDWVTRSVGFALHTAALGESHEDDTEAERSPRLEAVPAGL
jgi:hypothetical protein